MNYYKKLYNKIRLYFLFFTVWLKSITNKYLLENKKDMYKRAALYWKEHPELTYPECVKRVKNNKDFKK